MRIRVAIISPFRGKNAAEVHENLEIARALCHMAVISGYAPFAPHLFFPEFLDDSIAKERNLGIECGMAFLATCSAAWVYVENGITDDMKAEIEHFRGRGIEPKEIKGDI